MTIFGTEYMARRLADRLNHDAEPGDRYDVVMRADGRFVVVLISNGEFIGSL